MIQQSLLREQLKKRSHFYLYEEAAIRSAAKHLQDNFPEAQFLYSIKCNSAGRVLDTVFSSGLGADAASVGEVFYALERGVPANHIYFSAPGRTEAEFLRVWGRCIIIADSLRELELLSKIAVEQGVTAEIGVRLNPSFTFTSDLGIPTKFGIDQETFFQDAAYLDNLPGLKIVGIHVHVKRQELRAELLTGYHQKMFHLATQVQNLLGRQLDFVNFGSGLGIPFAPDETALNLESVGASYRQSLMEFRKHAPDTRILIETGRYVVGKSGVYVTQVLDKKVSRGKTFLLLCGTLNAFARPAISRMVRTLVEKAPPCEPIFTCSWSEDLIPLTENMETETVTLCGNLCSAADTVAQDLTLPRMEVGDGIVFTNAGCYDAVMTPMQFASLEKPAQLLLTIDGQILET